MKQRDEKKSTLWIIRVYCLNCFGDAKIICLHQDGLRAARSSGLGG